MTDPHLAQRAAEALIALGWPVEPAGDDMAEWMIGDVILDDSELIAFAVRKGIVVTGEEQ